MFLTFTLYYGETDSDITYNILLHATSFSADPNDPPTSEYDQESTWVNSGLLSAAPFLVSHTPERFVAPLTHLSQVLLDDVVPHLRRVQLRVEPRSDHRHDVVDAAEAGLVGQQIPARGKRGHEWNGKVIGGRGGAELRVIPPPGLSFLQNEVLEI